MTIAVTCALSARPLPVTAALTSVGVCIASGSPSRAAASIGTADACAVPMIPLMLALANTRSTATASGACRASHRSISVCRASSRCSGASVCGVRTTPTATIRSGWPSPPSTMPRPHRVSPGSTPSTRTGATSLVVVTARRARTGVRLPRYTAGTDAGARRPRRTDRPAVCGQSSSSSSSASTVVADVAVGPDVLHVVAVLERVDDAEHLAGAVGVELDLQGGHERRLGRVVVDAGGLQGGADRHEVTGLADDLEGLTEVVDLLGAGVQDHLEQVVLGQRALGHGDDALAGEDVGDAAGVGQLAAVAGQRGAHLGRGAVAVVGEALDQHRDPAGRVALVHDGLPVGATGLGARCRA